MKVHKAISIIFLSIIGVFISLCIFALISGNIKYKKYKSLNENELMAKIIKNKFILGTNLSEEELKELSPKEMVYALGDKYSDFLTKEELEQSVKELNDSYVGLGFEASKRKGEELEILNILNDSPSFNSGLKIGDKILKIDNKETKNMDRNESLSLIRGEEDSIVNLTVQRDNDVFNISVIRKPIESEVIEYKMLNNNIGYIYISNFPQEVIPIASYLLEDSITHIYSVKRKDGTIDKYMRETQEIFIGPIVVLCNKSTASSAELLISILRDYNRCILIGEQTYGKQISQEFIYLESGNVLKLSTGLLLSPSQNIYNEKGLEPDITVYNKEQYGDENSLDKAISYLMAI